MWRLFQIFLSSRRQKRSIIFEKILFFCDAITLWYSCGLGSNTSETVWFVVYFSWNRKERQKKTTLTADWQTKLAADALKSLTFSLRDAPSAHTAALPPTISSTVCSQKSLRRGTLAPHRAGCCVSTGVWAGRSVVWRGGCDCTRFRLDSFGLRLSLSGFGWDWPLTCLCRFWARGRFEGSLKAQRWFSRPPLAETKSVMATDITLWLWWLARPTTQTSSQQITGTAPLPPLTDHLHHHSTLLCFYSY